MTPRLAASTKRLAELTPKTTRTARPRRRTTRRPPKSPARRRGTTRSTPSCAPPAPCSTGSTTTRPGSGARLRANSSRARRSRARQLPVQPTVVAERVARSASRPRRRRGDRRRVDIRARRPRHGGAGAGRGRGGPGVRARSRSSSGGSGAASLIAIPTPNLRHGCAGRWRRPGRSARARRLPLLGLWTLTAALDLSEPVRATRAGRARRGPRRFSPAHRGQRARPGHAGAVGRGVAARPGRRPGGAADLFAAR